VTLAVNRREKLMNKGNVAFVAFHPLIYTLHSLSIIRQYTLYICCLSSVNIHSTFVVYHPSIYTLHLLSLIRQYTLYICCLSSVNIHSTYAVYHPL